MTGPIPERSRESSSEGLPESFPGGGRERIVIEPVPFEPRRAAAGGPGRRRPRLTGVLATVLGVAGIAAILLFAARTEQPERPAPEPAPAPAPAPAPEPAPEPEPDPVSPPKPEPTPDPSPQPPLLPAAATLEVVSQPPGATVEVGGAYRGSTPIGLELAPAEIHEVRVSKAGYRSFDESVELAAGEQRRLEAELEASPGRIELAVTPPDAELFVDGESRGEARGTLELPAAPHEVEVRKPGFEPHRQTVTPVPGTAQTLTVELVAAGRPVPAPAVLTSPEEHELRRIAPGRFTMGADRREPGRRANEVQRQVEITRPFYLATREVTNRQFRRFREGHLSGQVTGHSLETDHHPVVRVSWADAVAYCNWLSEKEGLTPVYERRGGRLVARRPLPDGYRLPTEAEWAWAARRSAGGSLKKYPWGDSLPIPPGAGNWADESALGFLPRALDGYRDGHPVTAPVDSGAPDAHGFYHLGSNVAEWVQDFYATMPGAIGSVESDPLGPEEGTVHVVRGASWMSGAVTELRLSFREGGGEALPNVGFRLARSLGQPPGGQSPTGTRMGDEEGASEP